MGFGPGGKHWCARPPALGRPACRSLGSTGAHARPILACAGMKTRRRRRRRRSSGTRW
jgi:hypothetical protein